MSVQPGVPAGWGTGGGQPQIGTPVGVGGALSLALVEQCPTDVGIAERLGVLEERRHDYDKLIEAGLSQL
jgi:hypothetical protein